MLSLDEIDDILMPLLRARPEEPRDAWAAWRAYEGWGVWANGGLEAVFTNSLGDEIDDVVAGLRHIGADAHADLFVKGKRLFPDAVVPGWDERAALPESLMAELCAGWSRLDEEIQRLPMIYTPLSDFLEARPELFRSIRESS